MFRVSGLGFGVLRVEGCLRYRPQGCQGLGSLGIDMVCIGCGAWTLG